MPRSSNFRINLRSYRRQLSYSLLALFAAIMFAAIGCLLIRAAQAGEPADRVLPLQTAPEPAADQLAQQGRAFYEAEQFTEAAFKLQQAVSAYEMQGDSFGQALALSNLSLTYQQISEWVKASAAIEQSLALVNQGSANHQPASAHILAQALDIKARLSLLQGQAEPALELWKQAAAAYAQAAEPTAVLEAQMNQAQALQMLGFYRQAIELLNQVSSQMQLQIESPELGQIVLDSTAQSVALRSLATALMVAGDLPRSRQALEQSLQLARSLSTASATYLALGNLTLAEATAKLNLAGLTPLTAMPLLSAAPAAASSAVAAALGQRAQTAARQFAEQAAIALDFYQQAERGSRQTALQAQLKQLHLLVETQQWERADQLSRSLQPQLSAQSPSRSAIYNQIEFAQSLLPLTQHSATPDLRSVAQILARAQQQASDLQDSRAQSYALGSLGELYETTQQFPAAQRLTQQALGLSQAADAAEISYRWQWQLGRLLRAEGDRTGAILAYQQAVETLQRLRHDLVAINRDVQFSFRERVEPVYRELVALLLQPNAEDLALAQARDVIEGLQVAELDNFFREACLDSQFQLDRVVDQSQSATAIFYTIVLPDRLEVVLKLPEQSLLHYWTQVSQSDVETTVDQLLNELKRPIVTQPLKAQSQQLYDWLMRPALTALEQSRVETLVFVLDGALRSMPMAALYDGQQYLLERYSIAIAPGLDLPDPQPLQQAKLHALIAGLSEARDNFPALSFVAQEIEQIQADLPSQVLFNQDFTRDNFRQAVRANPFSIVHIATHGQFSSNAAQTFILAWDQPLTVHELSQLLQANDLTNAEPIELLVLSACQTAVGDRRATLGLAGMAVQAGARSTIASLWNLDDSSGALFMRRFYESLVSQSLTAPISKAEALRRAQQTLLADPQYEAPRFWAPYVLLGNWL